jgi:septal ring factor EnvC (AmiA/AmiB activator)
MSRRVTRTRIVTLVSAAALTVVFGLWRTPLGAQQPAQIPLVDRVNDRLRALQEEAARLAGESRSLLGEVRRLEVERDIRLEEARRADAAVAGARNELTTLAQRIEALEQQRVAGLPEVRAQLVNIYKRGRTGYLRLLLSGDGLRNFARANRAVTALAYREERLIEDHKRTLEALRADRTDLQARTRGLRTRQAEAQQARQRAEAAVAARNTLIEQIDSRRDLTAQYVGELEVAHAKIESGGTAGAQAVLVPLAPFRGTLDWPVLGAVTGRFGQPSNRPGGALVRSGIEIASPEGTPVRAVHGGTVSYAEGFAGLGTLVILDHGDSNFSQYGYLSSVSVQRGQTVEAGAEVGRVGASPAGPPALYFEMRIDGRSTDPVQWLRPR